jgi:hypothetical protein
MKGVNRTCRFSDLRPAILYYLVSQKNKSKLVRKLVWLRDVQVLSHVCVNFKCKLWSQYKME